MLKRNYLILALAILCSIPGMSQRPGPDSTVIPDFRMDQYDKWENNEASFPPKPRDRWQVGLHTGMLRITGDVASQMGWGAGLRVRNAFGYTLSARFDAFFGTAYGLNWKPSSGIQNNPAVNGTYDPNVDYYNEVSGIGFIYQNYQTKWRQANIDFLFSFNNILFHHPKPKFSPYIFAGIGGLGYQVAINQLDENGNMYDYTTITPGTSNYEDHRDQRAQLKGMLDETYESKGEVDVGIPDYHDYQLRPVGSLGAGVGFRISPRFEFSLEYRAIITNDDLLDGNRWEEPIVPGARSPLTSNPDVGHYANFGLNFNIGKNALEPDWMRNPLTYVYDQIDYLAENLDFSDDDNDGVPNRWDEEPDTEPGAIVDTKGVTMDSDGDGCPDHTDPEPFSSPQYEIVDCQTQWPDIVSDLADDLNMTPEQIRESLADLIRGGGGGGNWFLPMIHFDFDKSYIRAEDYDELANVAQVMKLYPSLKVDVVGHTDVRGSEGYNEGLSKRRAEAAVQVLTDRFGVSASRFNLKFAGETDNIIPNARTEAQHQANRRVEFHLAK